MEKKQEMINEQIESLEEDVHDVVDTEAKQYNIAAVILAVVAVLFGGAMIAVWHHLLH